MKKRFLSILFILPLCASARSSYVLYSSGEQEISQDISSSTNGENSVQLNTISENKRIELRNQVMTEKYGTYNTAKSCWLKNGYCIDIREDNSLLYTDGEYVFLRASGYNLNEDSDYDFRKSLNTLIIYHPTDDGYQIMDSKEIVTFYNSDDDTYAPNLDNGYPKSEFLKLGPDTYGWVIIDGYEYGIPEYHNTAKFYAIDNGRITNVGEIKTFWMGGDGGDGGEVKCKISINENGKVIDGYYPLKVKMTGFAGLHDNFTNFNRVISIPFNSQQHKYVEPKDLLCNVGNLKPYFK